MYGAKNSVPIVTTMTGTWLAIAPARAYRHDLVVMNRTGNSLQIRNEEQPDDVITLADDDTIRVQGWHAWEGNSASGDVECLDNYD